MASLGSYAGTVGKKSLNLTAAGTLYDASVSDVSYLLLFINCSNKRKLGKVYLADNDAIRMPLSDLQSEDFCNLLRLFHFDFGLSIKCVSQDKKC